MIESLEFDNESVLDYSLNLANEYLQNIDYKQRKKIGQFFTPKKNAVFMADCVNIYQKKILLLDPGSGTGILSAAVCERILLESNHPVSLSIVAYENDEKIRPLLKDTFDACKQKFSERGHVLEYNIEPENFLSKNSLELRFGESNFSFNENNNFFDMVISNPPYYKMGKESLQSIALDDYVFGQPNIYSLFMILSAKMVKPGGDIVFITPRSFCSGFNYKKIREWFIKNTSFQKFHIFESRKKVFCEEKIHQETIIFHTLKESPRTDNKVNISLSLDRKFELKNSIRVSHSDIIYNKKCESFIRLPSSELELKIIEIVDSWSQTLQDIGLNISTGPIVDFRKVESLQETISDEFSVPLLWMQNLIDGKIVWPNEKNHNNQAIEINKKTINTLLPIKNYVLLRRVTSKEQKRRLCATGFNKNDFKKFKYIGLENHLNYIYKVEGELSEVEMTGLIVLLNTKIIDIYFRILNGNNQVNATEMRTLPMPTIEKIDLIGRKFKGKKFEIGYEMDCNVAELLEINLEVIDEIYASI